MKKIGFLLGNGDECHEKMAGHGTGSGEEACNEMH